MRNWILPAAALALLVPLLQPPAAAAQAAAGRSEAAPRDGGLGLLAAVEMALANDPNIALFESSLDAARGTLLATSGLFDPLLTGDLTESESDLPTGPDGAASESSDLSAAVGLTALLRNGLSLAPEVQLARAADGLPTTNTATVSFTARQPLLRGRGRAAVTAAERAAGHAVEAGRFDLRHTVALRLRAVTFQYWTAAAAAEDLEVLRLTEAGSRELLETTRRLIEADVTPAAEIVQLEADLVATRASRIAGEQVLFAARQDLGREIGLPPERIRSLPLPGDPFPDLDADAVPRGREAELSRQALARRDDLAAAGERRAASEAFVAAARNGLLPRLDLLFTPSYSGLVEGGDAGDFFSPLGSNVPGVSTQLGFSLSLPIGNRAARGALIETEEALRQSELAAELIAKQIGADVPIALDAVWRAAQQLELATVAIGLFERTLENEEKKLRAGSSTLIDVINQRDRLTAARRGRVNAQLALALALADLRFQTGTIVGDGGGDGEVSTVTHADLTTVPPLGPPLEPHPESPPEPP